jgi:3-methyladenine DNA glycosylase Tag
MQRNDVKKLLTNYTIQKRNKLTSIINYGKQSKVLKEGSHSFLSFSLEMFFHLKKYFCAE